MRAIFNPSLRHELDSLLSLALELANQKTGVDYIKTVLYYMSRGTGKISRTELETALLAQSQQGTDIMTTIAQEYIQEGIEIGRAEGLEQGLMQSILRILQQRFGSSTVTIQNQLAKADATQLQSLLDEALTTTDLDAFATQLTAVLENRE